MLDWLVFRDPGAAILGAAIRERRLVWVASAAMREELVRTLAYRAVAKWAPDVELTMLTFDTWAQIAEPAPPAPLELRCSDTDDQIFIDLAIAQGSAWLVTSDKALLRLRKRCLPHNIRVIRPYEFDLPSESTRPC